MSRLLSIDFDGFLHPAPPSEVSPFEFLPILVDLLKNRTDVDVVVHSSWRETYSSDEMSEFMTELGQRYIGTVSPGPRDEAILAFMVNNRRFTECLVLDDDAAAFPANFPLPLLICDPRLGLSDEIVQENVRLWLSNGASQPAQ